MVKKKELKKDIFIERLEHLIIFIRKRRRIFIACLIISLFIISFITFFLFQTKKKEERLQYMLSKAIVSFEEGNIEDSENYLQKIVKERTKVKNIAYFYLGKVKYIKGEKERAKEIFQDLRKEKNELIKFLAERELRQRFK